MKSGKKTTEFIFTTIFNLFAGLLTLGVIPGVSVDPNAALTSMAVANAGYAAARGIAKKGNGA